MVLVNSNVFNFNEEKIWLSYSYNYGNINSDNVNLKALFIINFISRGRNKNKFCCIRAIDKNLCNPIIHKFNKSELIKVPYYSIPESMLKKPKTIIDDDDDEGYDEYTANENNAFYN